MIVEPVDVFPVVFVGAEFRAQPLYRSGHIPFRSNPPCVPVHNGVQIIEIDIRIAGSDQEFILSADRPACVQRVRVSDRHVYVRVGIYVQFLDIVSRSFRSRTAFHEFEQRFGNVAADGSLDSDTDRPETVPGKPAGRNDLGRYVGIQLVVRLKSAQERFSRNRRVHKSHQASVCPVKQIAQSHAVRGVHRRNGTRGRDGNESPDRTEGRIHRGSQRSLVHKICGAQLLCRSRQKTARQAGEQ